VVVPLRDHHDEVVLRTRALPILADDGSGASWDPIKVEGEVASQEDVVGEDVAESDLVAAARVAPALWEWDGRVPSAEVPARVLRLRDGRFVTEAQSLAIVGDVLCGTMWVEVPTTDRSPRAEAIRQRRRGTEEYRVRGYAEEILFVRFPRGSGPRGPVASA